MGTIKEHADEFENISKSIVEYLLQNTAAEIEKTKPNKDGGYDVIVNCPGVEGNKCAFFECKLRKGNLNLRDIAANVIIAFNHGAIAFVAITNYDFTQQTGKELVDFSRHTILNVKLIIGEDLRNILKESQTDISDELLGYIDIKDTVRKNDFKALRINFDENILSQIFSQNAGCTLEDDTQIEQLFDEKIEYISSSLQRGGLVTVRGYLGVGKHRIIQAALKKVRKHLIEIDATLYETKDLLILNILSQIWGLSTIQIFSLFSKNDVEAILEVIGDRENKKETVELLTSLLNETYAHKHSSARNNILLCNYIINLLTLHKEDIGFVVYIKKLQFANQETYDFLLYFITYVAEKNIGCVVSYQEPEYELQKGNDLLGKLHHIEQCVECQIKLLEKEDAILYIRNIRPTLPSYVAEAIVAKVGTRLYNLLHMLKSLLPDESTMDSNAVLHKLQWCTPNNIPSLLSYSLARYKEIYPEIFELCYLFECRVPIELCIQIDRWPQISEHLSDVGVFCCDYEMLIAQNEFVQDWIMHAYSSNSPRIQMVARNLLSQTLSRSYNVGYINIYRVLGRSKEALSLLEKNLDLLKREKQYTSLRRSIFKAIEIAKESHNYMLEITYLIELLNIITIQKEISTEEARIYLEQLENYSQCNLLSQKETDALTFFKLKRAFKSGVYTKENNSEMELAKYYYENCIQRNFTNNEEDWLGKICGCYALFVKATQGNEAALEIFEKVIKIFPDSFELRREYYSHIACMQLFEKPLEAFGNYQKILRLFEKEAPDSAALPFHEYGDLAMCQLIAQNLDYALLLAKDAIEIGRANGLLDEEGRCLNIRGCIEWCLGNLSAAEENFREATTIMNFSRYAHYAWRSQLNLLQISLITGSYSDHRLTMLENLYADFSSLLAKKIKALADRDEQTFRKTVEYHALLIFGVLWNTITDDKQRYLKVCTDFGIEKHKEIYRKDINSFLSGDYSFINSPYIQNGYIFFVG